MPVIRSVQHKPKREEQKAKEMQELRQENRLLKRKVARLEKELAKRETAVVEEVEKNEETEATIPVETSKESCSKCAGTVFAELTLRGKTYVVCKNPTCLNRWIR